MGCEEGGKEEDRQQARRGKDPHKDKSGPAWKEGRDKGSDHSCPKACDEEFNCQEHRGSGRRVKPPAGAT